jgi:hypothetical protein
MFLISTAFGKETLSTPNLGWYSTGNNQGSTRAFAKRRYNIRNGDTNLIQTIPSSSGVILLTIYSLLVE